LFYDIRPVINISTSFESYIYCRILGIKIKIVRINSASCFFHLRACIYRIIYDKYTIHIFKIQISRITGPSINQFLLNKSIYIGYRDVEV